MDFCRGVCTVLLGFFRASITRIAEERVGIGAVFAFFGVVFEIRRNSMTSYFETSSVTKFFQPLNSHWGLPQSVSFHSPYSPSFCTRYCIKFAVGFRDVEPDFGTIHRTLEAMLGIDMIAFSVNFLIKIGFVRILSGFSEPIAVQKRPICGN